MFKKSLSLILAGILLNTVICVKPALAESKAEKHTKRVEKLKADIAKLGVGEDARIKVKMRDKTKLEGYISEVREDSFVITDPKTGDATAVAYSNVVQAKGYKLSKRGQIILVVAIVVGLFVVLFVSGRSLK